MLERSGSSYNKTTLTIEELESRLEHLGDVINLPRIINAYEMARSVHEFQFRNDGTPYFDHCARTAKILIDELGVYDPDVLVASLLHDVLEDSDTVTRGVLEYNFGSYVAYIVGTLTKDLDKAKLDPQQVDIEHAEIIRKASDDCLLIKLAARLDNVRCLAFNLKRSPLIYLRDTLERYVPMADESSNAALKVLSAKIRMDSNKYLG